MVDGGGGGESLLMVARKRRYFQANFLHCWCLELRLIGYVGLTYLDMFSDSFTGCGVTHVCPNWGLNSKHQQ